MNGSGNSKIDSMNDRNGNGSGSDGSVPLMHAAAKIVAVVSLVFAGLIAALLLVNYIQTQSADPLNSEAINRLMLELRDNPGDEALKEQIRALDLLARKAYFTSRRQIRTGGFLLFLFAASFLAAMKYVSSFRSRYPDLTVGPDDTGAWESRLLARRYMIAGGLGLFAAAVVMGLLNGDELSFEGDVSGVGRQSSAEESGNTAAPVFADPSEMRRNWPNFRGPDGNGVAAVDTAPVSWDGASGEHILWKTEIPLPGYNSPIVWDNRLFLSGADLANMAVFCFDTDTGAILWRADLNDIPGSPAQKPDNSEDTGLAAPTMATNGVYVYVLFGTGDVACLDFEGNRVWAKNLGVPENHYGHSSSLITFRDLLLVQYDQNTGARLIALAAATGAPVYDQDRLTGISWASPIIVDTGGRHELILNSSPDVISYDPATGAELWRVDCMGGEVAPSLAYAEGRVFAVNEYAKLAAITLEGTPAVLWESMDDLAEVSSPVATKDFVFVATSYGTISCFDAVTGERYWYEDLPRGFYSSAVLVGENVYLMDMQGLMYIFRAAKAFSLVGTCHLGEGAVTVPAFMHGRIYIRGNRYLYCIGE